MEVEFVNTCLTAAKKMFCIDFKFAEKEMFKPQTEYVTCTIFPYKVLSLCWCTIITKNLCTLTWGKWDKNSRRTFTIVMIMHLPLLHLHSMRLRKHHFPKCQSN